MNPSFMRVPTSWGDGEFCLGGCRSVMSGILAMHCYIVAGLWAVVLLQYTATLHCLRALGQWDVDFLRCTATLSEGSGQWNSCNVVPRRLRAAG